MSAGIVIVGLEGLVADLASSTPRLAGNAATAVAVTSRKVQQSARARVRGHRHIPQYPASITYDVTAGPAGAEGEIGPDKNRAQGPLGNIIEYGTPKNPPIEHLGPALEENAEDLVHGIEVALHQALP
ncbi:hypothetical protein [Actinacidiphila sp. ITFR-21]|uniref:hypothetical protein n=1 Tax=Actinacidiphila sp. ITFR-21 TaxID=3075199 RepID=UPI00288A8419|nr:hypothetical protein [Streptomyces sp. ITFR-21]WNI16617.1 hypothetical protein RLT57_14595 [Streptomyces sp. ITFR-21]